VKEKGIGRLRILLKTSGDFWCEASVLVAVFSLLDKILRLERLPSSRWALGTLLITVVSFGIGTLLKIWAEE
jgi:hypothetical protein